MRIVEDKEYLPLLSYDTVSTAGAVTHVARVVIALVMEITNMIITKMLRCRLEIVLINGSMQWSNTCHCSANGSDG